MSESIVAARRAAAWSSALRHAPLASSANAASSSTSDSATIRGRSQITWRTPSGLGPPVQRDRSGGVDVLRAAGVAGALVPLLA